jgi:hypothetical protein
MNSVEDTVLKTAALPQDKWFISRNVLLGYAEGPEFWICVGDGRIDFEQFLWSFRCIIGIVVCEIHNSADASKSVQGNDSKNGHDY